MAATTDDILAPEERRCAAQIGKDEAELTSLLFYELRYTHRTGWVDTKANYVASSLENMVVYQTVEHTDTEAQLVGSGAVVVRIPTRSIGRCYPGRRAGANW